MNDNILPREFYNYPALTVARNLLGAVLVRIEEDQRISGIITETEAYCGEQDLGCHCRSGRTERTQAMYGQPGHAYIYFTYGMHWMLNLVVEPEGKPAAILIRAIHPTEGLNRIAKRRTNIPPKYWTNGPGKICQALNIDKRFYGVDICSKGSGLFVEKGIEIPDTNVTIGPRVGLNTVPEPWKSKPWRFQASITNVANKIPNTDVRSY